MLSNEQLKQLGIDEQDFSQLNGAERNLVIQILDEMQNTGISSTFNDLVKEDYNEMPADILTFVDDYNYLGNAWHDAQGKSKLYPYWREELVKIFPDNLSINANYGIFGGSRGRGKSEVCVLILTYLLHRVMCMKDPIEFYHLKPTEKLVFAFMNIKLDLAEEIATSKFQNSIQSSPWFMNRGTITGRSNKIWTPNPINGKDAIEIKIGSQADDLIGLPVYACLDGNTPILTDTGEILIKDLVDCNIKVPTVDENGNIITSEICTVKPTAIANDYMEITLEDNTIIKCTLNHRFMLSDGTYKEAKDLTEDDDLMTIKPFGYIYKYTDCTTGKIYIGKREKPYFDTTYWGSGKIWAQVLNCVGKDNVKREILCWASSRNELKDLEIKFISELKSNDPSIGYNIHRGGSGGNSLNDTEKWSELHRGPRNGRYGKPVSQETRDKISKANKGRTYSAEVNKTKGRPGVPKPEGFGEKISKAQKGRKKTPQELANRREGAKKAAEKNRGKSIYNNGLVEIRLHPNEEIPEGFIKGRLQKVIQNSKNNCNLPRNYKWYNDGKVERFTDVCPEGFTKGRLKKCE